MGVRRAAASALGAALLAAASAGAVGFSDASSNPSNSFQAAADFCAAPGEQVVGASQDAYVNSLLTGSNFGGSTQLLVSPGLLSLLAQTQALVQFSLPAVPSHCDLTGATLRLYATNPASGRTINVLRNSASWTENGVTWSNAPGTAGTAVSSASLASPGFQSWDVLAHVQAMYGGANNGFRVRDTGGALSVQQVYQSREGTPNGQDPELRLTFG